MIRHLSCQICVKKRVPTVGEVCAPKSEHRVSSECERVRMHLVKSTMKIDSHQRVVHIRSGKTGVQYLSFLPAACSKRRRSSW